MFLYISEFATSKDLQKERIATAAQLQCTVQMHEHSVELQKQAENKAKVFDMPSGPIDAKVFQRRCSTLKFLPICYRKILKIVYVKAQRTWRWQSMISRPWEKKIPDFAARCNQCEQQFKPLCAGEDTHEDCQPAPTCEDQGGASSCEEVRIFEAVSSGAVFVSEHVEELERLFGDCLLYVKKDGDTRMQLSLLSCWNS